MLIDGIKIRNERTGDAESIHAVVERAFRHAPHTDHTEQFIVAGLRASGALAVSLVAEARGKIVGHVAVSAVRIADGSTDWYGLGPISVAPEFQRAGVGTRLMNEALAALNAINASGCVVLGDPGYYGRFGFSSAEELSFPGVPPEYFQALCFDGDVPKGEVVYHEAFYGQS